MLQVHADHQRKHVEKTGRMTDKKPKRLLSVEEGENVLGRLVSIPNNNVSNCLAEFSRVVHLSDHSFNITKQSEGL